MSKLLTAALFLSDIVRVIDPKHPDFGKQGKILDSLCRDFDQGGVCVDLPSGGVFFTHDQIELIEKNTEPNRVFLAAQLLCGRKDISAQRDRPYGVKLSIRMHRNEDGSEEVRFYLYENLIASISERGRLFLTDAGYQTVMTREGLKRVCENLPIAGHVFQKKYELYYDDGTASRDPMKLESASRYGARSLTVDVDVL